MSIKEQAAEIREIVTREIGSILESRCNMNSYAGPQPVRVGSYNYDALWGQAISENDCKIAVASLSSEFEDMTNFQRSRL